MSEMTTVDTRALTTSSLPADFGTFLRLHIADGDQSPHTIASYHGDYGRGYSNWNGY
jgi:hypothetical protein